MIWGYGDTAGGRKAPCYRCEKRHIGCHEDCDKYKAFKTEREAIKAKREADKSTAIYNF